PRGFETLRREQGSNERAKLRRLAVGQEVRIAATPAVEGQANALEHVLDVTGRCEVATTRDPQELSLLHRAHELRQERRIATPPDEAGSHYHRLELRAVGREHPLLGKAFRGGVQAN